MLKAAVTDMRYFARSNFSEPLFHKKSSGLIRKIVFKLESLFHQGK